jgi:hypothetical protein
MSGSARRLKHTPSRIAPDLPEEGRAIAVAQKIARATETTAFVTDSDGNEICVIRADNGQLRKILRENFSTEELRQLIAMIEAKLRTLH